MGEAPKRNIDLLRRGSSDDPLACKLAEAPQVAPVIEVGANDLLSLNG